MSNVSIVSKVNNASLNGNNSVIFSRLFEVGFIIVVKNLDIGLSMRFVFSVALLLTLQSIFALACSLLRVYQWGDDGLNIIVVYQVCFFCFFYRTRQSITRIRRLKFELWFSLGCFCFSPIFDINISQPS